MMKVLPVILLVLCIGCLFCGCALFENPAATVDAANRHVGASKKPENVIDFGTQAVELLKILCVGVAGYPIARTIRKSVLNKKDV